MIGFAAYPLDRLAERREDALFIAARRHAASTRFIAFVGDRPVLRQVASPDGDPRDVREVPFFSAADRPSWGSPIVELFLGEGDDGVAVFGLLFEEAGAQRAYDPGVGIADLRGIASQGLVSPEILGLLGCAKAVFHWHRRHRFCPNCGAVTQPAVGGWRRDCDGCATQHFPRVDPVVIMLVTDGDRCLLGRQPRFASGMYSALAGFLEPGETVEAAVQREVHEEAGIRCDRVVYHASQPWPFPASLMLGCFARAIDTTLVIDSTELEDARWFSRDEVASLLGGTHAQGLSAPSPYAIAHHLMLAFVTQGERTV